MSEENKNIPEEEIKDTEEKGVEGERTEAAAEEQKTFESRAFFSSESTSAVTEQTKKKPERKVSLVTFICSCVAVALAAVMLSLSASTIFYEIKLAQVKEEAPTVQTGDPNVTSEISELELLRQLFEKFSFCDLDEEQMKLAVLRAYVEATGDKYARYYTDEEYEELITTLGGDTEGIGINIINSEVVVGGVTYKALKVVNVMKNAPADTAGLKRGDYIVAVGTLAENTAINVIGYDEALAALKGASGTQAQFLVYRQEDTDYVLKEFAITRAPFETSYVMQTSVTHPTTSEKIGVVLITQFYYETPKQVSDAIEALKAEGCTKFVFDLRNNPGGLMTSIVATLSYFLEEGDTVISVVDKPGNSEITKVAPINSYTGQETACNVKAEDIGKYKDLNMVVLCNEGTASAAELFVANFRDHELAKIVGTTTYGKGSVQTYVPLAYYGFSGYIKMTVKMYYPPCGVGYDGIGIQPHVNVELSSLAATKNVYDIFGDLSIDNQLAEAIKYFK
ncbi:MAG: hypothetical protein E7653_07025 [Ruminococcaceae bacterium]|nr:hypothetical protein [Oscillospiraceae bacterium]